MEQFRPTTEAQLLQWMKRVQQTAKEGGELTISCNTVVSTNNPSAHAEFNAIEVAFHGNNGECNNRKFVAATTEFACRFLTVHDRHLHVHFVQIDWWSVVVIVRESVITSVVKT